MVFQSLSIIIPKFWHEIHNPFNLFIYHLALGRRERCSCFISAQESHGIPGLTCSVFASEIGLDFVLCGYCLQSLLWSQKGLLFNWVAKNLSSKWKRQPGFSLICKDQVMESLLDLIGPHWLMLMRFLVDPLCPPELQVLDELHVWSSIKDVLRCSEGWWWLDELQHFFFFTSLKGAQVFFPYCHSYFHWC